MVQFMKILYLGAPVQKALSVLYGKKMFSQGGGWYDSLLDSVAQQTKNNNYKTSYVFFTKEVEKICILEIDEVKYYIIPALKGEEKFCSRHYKFLKEVIDEFNPDIIHIFGTERKKTLAALQIMGASKCVISISGLISLCEKHYCGGLDEKHLFSNTLNDFIRRMSPLRQKKGFKILGKTEIKVLQQAKFVFGRTTWDYACVKQSNPNIHYFHVGEIMRPVFYQYQWNRDNIERNSIFVSQGTYPLKGLHKMLEALPLILKRFPDAHLYVAGANLTSKKTLKDRIKRTTYGKYLMKLIKKHNIENNITFLGGISGEEVCQRLLKTHVFVSPSIIENSSNSLGEAMLLGVPCVASCVGGTQDLLKDREEGFLYPFNEEYMLAHYICEIFEKDELALEFSNKARKKALRNYDSKEIVNTSLAIYEKIISQQV